MRYENTNNKRVRVYRILTTEDQREQVFSHWLNKDRQRPGNSLFWSPEQSLSMAQSQEKAAKDNFLQLSLDI